MKLYQIKHLSLLMGLSILIFSCSRSNFSRLQKKGTVDEKYKAAIKYYQKADYYRAGVLLEEVTPILSGDSTAERAQFYNAYCNYYQKNYTMSAYLFKTFYATYSISPFAEEAYYMYANSMYKDAPEYDLDQTNTITAIDALQTYLNTFPDSKYSNNCSHDLNDLRNRLEKKAYEKCKLYYKTREPSFLGRSNYKATVVSVNNFKKDFPDSKYNEELAYIQVVAQEELANVSFYTKQKERYNEALSFYEKFIDKYPKSQYLPELQKYYDRAQKGLVDLAKLEKSIEESKKIAEKENKVVNKQ